jgi:glycosyltransferase involved in cell wall biosynthesis
MLEESPLVSVIAICYNHSRFIVECLESIRSQTYQNIELVIVDDCSVDDSTEVIRQWIQSTGSSATFVAHDCNTGICRSRNDALALVNGTYVSFISTDDYWLPPKVARQVAILEQRRDAAVVYGDARCVDENNKPLENFFVQACSPVPAPRGNIYYPLLERSFIAPGPLVRLDHLRKVGRYDEALAYEDWDMWLRIAKRYRFAFTSHVDVVKRQLPTSLYNTLGRRLPESDLQILLKHVDALPSLWGRIAALSYVTGHPQQRYFLWRGLQQQWWCRRLLVFLALSTLGIRYERVVRIKKEVDRWTAKVRAQARHGTPTAS